MSVLAGRVDWSAGESGAVSAAWREQLQFVVAEREAAWHDAQCALFVKRLIVRETDRTEVLLQPDEAGVVVALEGHLYNLDELRRTLGLPAAAESGRVVAAAWRKWGDGFAARLNGEFALAAWDPRARRLLLAVDHVATVPLYWRPAASGWVFGTELSTVTAGMSAPLQPDWERIADYLANTALTPDRTFYRDVFTVPRAHTVVLAEHGATPAEYWRYETGGAGSARAFAEGIEAARAALHQAVRARLSDTAGTAAHLTGGLDSSAVAAVAAHQQRAAGRQLHLYSIVPWLPGERTEHSDADYIPHFLRAYPECGHRYVLGQMESRYDLPGQPDGPVNFQLTTAIREVVAHARGAGCRAMLTGWGGEASATYYGNGIHHEALRQRKWRWLWTEMCAAAPTWRNRAAWCRNLMFREFRPQLDRSGAQTWPLLQHVLQPEFIREYRMEERCQPPRDRGGRPLEHGLARMLAGILRQGRLKDWSFQARAEGFRYRYPLLDREFLEVVRTLPPEVHTQHGRRRELVRRLLGDWLPLAIIQRTNKTSPSAAVTHKREIPLPPGDWTTADRLGPVLRAWPARADSPAELRARLLPTTFGILCYRLLEVDGLLRQLARAPVPATRPTDP